MSEIPQTWVLATLDQISFITSGIGFPLQYQGKDSGALGFYKVGDISRAVLEQGGRLQNPQHFVTLEIAEKLKGKSVSPGATVFAKIGEAIKLNRRAYVIHECLIDNNVMAIKAIMNESDRYLHFFLKTQKFGDLSRSTTVPSLRKGDIEELLIPLAPINEQKRIVDKLDAIFTRVDACCEHLDRIPVILKRFRQSVLAAATSGKLTEDWRESNHFASEQVMKEIYDLIKKRRDSNPKRLIKLAQPDLTYWTTQLPESWQVASVSAFAECLDYKRVPVKREDRGNLHGLYPYYGANGLVDTIDDFIFDDELVLVTEDETFYGRVKPIAYRSSGKCWVNNHAHVLRAANEDSSDYLCYSLMYYNVIPWLTGTSGRAKLTQAVLNALPVGVPPQKEITEIVRRVKILLSYADRLEAHYNNIRIQVDHLTPALLSKAFRGELVPQDPNDEPASVLLERIRATHAAEPVKKRPKKVSGRPKKIQKLEAIMLHRKDIKEKHLTNILKERGPLAAETLWSASQLDIDDFYDQLKVEEEQGLLQEQRSDFPDSPRLLEAAA